MKPLLSVVIPTVGRQPGLEWALESVVHQLSLQYLIETLVVGDTHGGPDLSLARALAQLYGAKWLECDGGCWGQQQRQLGMEQASGRYVAFLADDDIWLDGALEAIARGIADTAADPRPLLFRVHHWLGWPIWDLKVVAPGHVDANCVVVPNVPEKLGRWGLHYEGDHDFIRQTAAAFGSVEWRPEFIGRCRPKEADLWAHRGQSTGQLV